MCAFTLERDRNRELRNAVEEIGGAVERIDDPGLRRVAAVMLAAFLAEETVARPRLGQLLAQNLFRLSVGGGDEIAGPFSETCRFSHFAEVALEPARRPSRGFDHDIEKSGVEHAFPAVIQYRGRDDGYWMPRFRGA